MKWHFVGKLKDLFRNRDGEWVASFSTPEDPRELFDQLRDVPLDIEFKKHSKKRSLDANAYAWVLIDKIADVMHISKSFVYRMAIRDIGGVSEMAYVDETKAERMIQWWQRKGLGWQVEEMDRDVPGYIHLIFYCGSSEYNTEQMARLIDLLVQEAEALGIPTISPKEEAELMERWGRKVDAKQTA